MQQPIEEGGDRRRVPEELSPIIYGTFEVRSVDGSLVAAHDEPGEVDLIQCFDGAKSAVLLLPSLTRLIRSNA